MSAGPKFTIVTPSFNQAGYIEETIRSVVSQEGPFEIEYFIMDGGSTDGSVEIIRKYADDVNAGRYPIACKAVRIHWKSEKDAGQSDAINCGLRQATGDFASYINSDDLYAPGAFAKVAEVFAGNPRADFIYGDGDVIDERGALQWEWLSRPYDHKVMTTYHFLWNEFSNYIIQQSVFWRTRVHGSLGLFDESFHYAMDVEYWVRAGSAGLVLLHVPVKLGKFRFIQGTKSKSGAAVFWADTLEIVRRRRGAHRLTPYLAYYYLNLAAHNGWDLAAAEEQSRDALRRWAALPNEEQKVIERARARAYGVACCLIANELQKSGRRDQARVFLWRGFKHLPSAIARPAGFFPLLKQMTGPSCSAWIDRVANWLIAEYRRRRFDYRYHQKPCPGESQ